MIQIEGLTTKQRVFADVIWACQSESQVMSFILSMPPADRKDAYTVLTMMTAAVVDEVTEIDPAVTKLLQRIRLTGD